MSITKRQGIGGISKVRKLSRAGEKAMKKDPLQPGSRNARRLERKLRQKYGDEVIDKAIAEIKS